MPIHEDAELEQVVHDDPDNPDAWQVYADALHGHGDPRAALIYAGVRGESADLPRLLEIYDEEVWGAARSVGDGTVFDEVVWTGGWAGATPEPLEASVELAMSRFGLVDGITVTGLDEDGHVARAIAAVLASPMGRFTRQVHLEVGERFFGPSGQPSYDPVLALMTRANPVGLRVLEIQAGGYQLSWTDTGNLGPLLRTATRLEEVTIEHGRINFGRRRIDLPRLRRLVLESGGLSAETVVAIGRATWPALETLVLFLGTRDYGGDTEPAQLDGILRRPEAFPRLHHLALCNADIQGAVLHLVAASALLRQLRTLDLSKGTLTDDELGPVVDHPEDFRHLETLDVSNNYLSADAIAALHRALPRVRVLDDDQRHAEMVRDRAKHAPDGVYPEWAPTGFRYTTVGE